MDAPNSPSPLTPHPRPMQPRPRGIKFPISQNGDFNYDDVINADDYFLIDSSYIGQRGPLHTGAVQPSAVPEPTGLIVLAAGMAGLAMRRRHVAGATNA